MNTCRCGKNKGVLHIVEIGAGWENEKQGQYIACEVCSSNKHARRPLKKQCFVCGAKRKKLYIRPVGRSDFSRTYCEGPVYECFRCIRAHVIHEFRKIVIYGYINGVETRWVKDWNAQGWNSDEPAFFQIGYPKWSYPRIVRAWI